MELGDLRLPELRSFELRTSGLARPMASAVIAATWPKLERLVLSVGAESEAGLADLVPLIAAAPGGLHELGLVDCDFGDAFLAVLAKSRLAGQLTRLELSGAFPAECAGLLAKHRDRFPRLDLDRSCISPTGKRRARDGPERFYADEGN